MNFDKKNFLGKLNSDIDERLFSSERFKNDYSDAYNVLVLSAIDSGIGLVKGFKGTTEIPITYDYSSSARKVIGRHADLQTRKIYFFIAHSTTSNANDGIYELDVLSKTVEKVLKGSFLKLNNVMRITGIDVIDGKYLLYTDGINEPRNIDIARAKAGELTSEIQITAIKPAPIRPPYGLENITDPTYNDNNIRGNFFQFKYRWVYKDNTKSTFSPISKISTMGNLFMPEVEQVVNYEESNAIKFNYNIPNEDVVSVDIAARVGNTGDFSIVENIDTNPENVYKSCIVYVKNFSLEPGVTISLSIDGEFPTGGTFKQPSVAATVAAIESFFITEGFDDRLEISSSSSDGYVLFTSKEKSIDFEIVSSNSDLAEVIITTDLPSVGENFYLFKNNNILLSLDVRESNLEYDRIPLKALAQKAVNGSNIVYGGITEGFDIGDVNISADFISTSQGSTAVTATSVSSELARFSVGVIDPLGPDLELSFNDGTLTNVTIPAGSYTVTQLTTLIYNAFLAARPSIKIYVPSVGRVVILSSSGNTISASSNNGLVPVVHPSNGANLAYTSSAFSLAEGSVFILKVVKNSTNYYFSYTSVDGDNLGLALINLCDIVNNNPNSIVAYPLPASSSEIKVYSSDGENIEAFSFLTASPLSSTISLKEGDSYIAGIVYADQFGRISPVVSNQSCKIEVPFYGSNSVQQFKPVAFISTRPPSWAKYWYFVLTKRRKVNSFLQFGITTIGADGDKMRFYLTGAKSNLPFYNDTFGAKLSYEFAEGDRVKFVRYKSGEVFGIIEDLPILGVAEDGALETPFLKNTTLDYEALEGCIVEVYKPNNYTEASVQEVLFYETGLSGFISNPGESNRYHNVYDEDLEDGSAQPQTVNLSAPLICRPNTGDVWSKTSRLIDFTKDGSGIPNSWSVGDITYFMSMFQSDRYPTTSTNQGRPNAFDKDSKQVFRKATAFFSEPYFVDSDVNNINRVYANSFKDYDQTYGAIKLFYLDGFELYNFQENKVGVIPTSRQMVYNQDGTSSLILSSELLNDCRYFDYAGGINNNPESFCFNQFNKYFVDIENNAVCKIGGNGIIRISDIGMTSHFTEVFVKYKKTNPTLASGQTPRFYGAWDEDNKLVIFAPETIIESPGDPVTTSADTIAFSENQGGWSTKIDFKPNAIIGAFGELISWSPSDGKAWTHNTNETRNLFYGSQKTRSIEIPSSINPSMSQSFLSLIQEPAMLADDRYDSIVEGSAVDPSIWNVPTISTSLGQESNLLVEDFEKREGVYFAGFYRDTTTPVDNPLLEGDALKGVWIKLKLTNSSTKDIGLNSIAVGSIPSKRTGA